MTASPAWESVFPSLPLRGRWQRVALTEGTISHGNSSPPVARADSPLPAGALQRGAAALTGRRTPRAFVPLRSTAGRRPLRAVQRTCPIGRLALIPPFIPAGVFVYRAAEQSIPPVMQCAHLPFRRQQASSHPLTCHGMVPQASRTALFRHNKTPRLSSWGFVLALPIFPGRLQPSIVSRSELN